MLGVRYGKLPSEIKDRSIQDLQFDILVAQIGMEHQAKEQKKAQARARGGHRKVR